jgi:WD40 repeat protein
MRVRVLHASDSASLISFFLCVGVQTISVWDFDRAAEEQSLKGHGWDVKSVSWHPYKALLVSGSKDNLIKLWVRLSSRSLSALVLSCPVLISSLLFPHRITGPEERQLPVHTPRPQKHSVQSHLERERQLVYKVFESHHTAVL